MILRRRAGSSARSVLWHDQAGFCVTASRPVAMQIDGEGVGEVVRADFRAVPQALRILC